MTAAVMTNKEWAALTRALDRPEWLEDERFTTPALRDQNIDARLQMTQDVLKTRTTEEWLERLEAEGVPCAPVLTRDQVIAHPQMLASGILIESDHAVAGPPAADAHRGALRDADGRALRRPAPRRAQRRDLRRAGFVRDRDCGPAQPRHLRLSRFTEPGQRLGQGCSRPVVACWSRRPIDRRAVMPERTSRCYPEPHPHTRRFRNPRHESHHAQAGGAGLSMRCSSGGRTLEFKAQNQNPYPNIFERAPRYGRSVQ